MTETVTPARFICDYPKAVRTMCVKVSQQAGRQAAVEFAESRGPWQFMSEIDRDGVHRLDFYDLAEPR